jgi:hypothetical protein
LNVTFELGFLAGIELDSGDMGKNDFRQCIKLPAMS